jgi:DNA-binding response OmpR family regulator
MTGRQVLILIKAEPLGANCESVLRDLGCECTRMAIDETFSPAVLIEKLVREGQEVVLCEYRLPSYTVLTILRELNRASMSSRVQVVALTFDDQDEDEFRDAGGAACVVLKPGDQGNMEFVIGKAWRRLESQRNRLGKNRSDVIRYLSSLKDEGVFRQFAIELFNHLQYREARLSHGPMEAGKDLVFYEQNLMGELEFVGVQAKIGNLHGIVSQSKSVSDLLLQTAEAFQGKVSFGGESHYLDKYVILASGTITAQARAKIDDFLSYHVYKRRVYVWGQEKIADVKVQFASSFIYFPT